MKRQKLTHSLLKGTNRLLIALLGILGFSGCEDGGGINEYGTPYAGYSVKGKVVDTQNNGLENIQVYLQRENTPMDIIGPDTVYTDSDGNFTYEWNELFIHENEYELIAADKEKVFQSDTTAVSFKKEDFKGASGNWNYGTATKEVTFTLDKRNTNP